MSARSGDTRPAPARPCGGPRRRSAPAAARVPGRPGRERRPRPRDSRRAIDVEARLEHRAARRWSRRRVDARRRTDGLDRDTHGRSGSSSLGSRRRAAARDPELRRRVLPPRLLRPPWHPRRRRRGRAAPGCQGVLGSARRAHARHLSVRVPADSRQPSAVSILRSKRPHAGSASPAGGSSCASRLRR